jgi:hypothetical protein
MTRRDVYEDDMSDPFDRDAIAERMLTGTGQQVDPALAEFLAIVRSIHQAAAPAPNSDLEAFIAPAYTAAAPFPTPARRHGRRIIRVARLSAIGTAFFAATGSLAMAHALPAPVQDLASHLGVGRPARPHRPKSGTNQVPKSTPTAGVVTPGSRESAATARGQTPNTNADGRDGAAGGKSSATTVAPAVTSTTLRGGAPTVLPNVTTTTTASGANPGNGKSSGNANPAANANANPAANGKANGPTNGKAKGH